MGSIKVGTCGYGRYKPGEGWKEKYESKLQAYSDVFPVGEINQTFYRLPMVKTTQRWRKEVKEGFEFTVKAWQALTHPTSSPTWRKKKDKLTKKQEENFGYLRCNQQVIDAWEQVKKRVQALKAKVCILQTPGSFTCTSQNEGNMRQFLSEIDRDGVQIGWEPRGDWNQNPQKIKEICEDLHLIHVVDLMRERPLSDHHIAYLRLHGLNPNPYDYNYDYSQKELKALAEKLNHLAQTHDQVYCLFNNYQMYANAQQLMDLL